MRPTWFSVVPDAVAHNVKAFRDLVVPAAVCTVVKADGYGHGAPAVARAALGAGATWLAVALVEEAAELRDSGLAAPILVLSEPRPPRWPTWPASAECVRPSTRRRAWTPMPRWPA